MSTLHPLKRLQEEARLLLLDEFSAEEDDGPVVRNAKSGPKVGSVRSQLERALLEEPIVDTVARGHEPRWGHAVPLEVASALLADVEAPGLAEQRPQRDLFGRTLVPRPPVEQSLLVADQEAGSAGSSGREHQPGCEVRVPVRPNDIVPSEPDFANDVTVRSAKEPARDIPHRGARADPRLVTLQERDIPAHPPPEPDIVKFPHRGVGVEIDRQVDVGPPREFTIERGEILDRMGDEVRDADDRPRHLRPRPPGGEAPHPPTRSHSTWDAGEPDIIRTNALALFDDGAHRRARERGHPHLNDGSSVSTPRRLSTSARQPVRRLRPSRASRQTPTTRWASGGRTSTARRPPHTDDRR